jgi:hypothetical protein
MFDDLKKRVLGDDGVRHMNSTSKSVSVPNVLNELQRYLNQQPAEKRDDPPIEKQPPSESESVPSSVKQDQRILKYFTERRSALIMELAEIEDILALLHSISPENKQEP